MTGSVPALAQGTTRALNTRLCWLGLAIILVVAALLRLHAIAAASLWLDEATTWAEARRDFWPMIAAMTRDVHPPLHNSILHLVILAFGDTESALRLPSAVLGVAGVAAIFWAGSLFDGRATGFLAAALLCLSGFHIHYSQEARPYALLALSATLFAGATLRALETDRRRWHAASFAAALLLLYSHNYGLLLWLSLAIAVFVSARAWRDPGAGILARWAAWQVMAALLYLPWAVIVAGQYQRNVADGFWIPRPNLSFLRELIEDNASGGFMALALAAGAILALAPPSRLLDGVAGVRDTAGSHAATRRLLVVAWLLGPLLMGLIASLISQPILVDRYVICSLPAWLILAAAGFNRLQRRWGKWVLAAVVAGAIANLPFYHRVTHEDARAIAAAYVAQAKAEECVYVFRPYSAAAVEYYLRNRPSCFQRAKAVTDITPWTLASPRAWLFLGYLPNKERQALAESLQAHGWQARAVIFNPSVSLLALEPTK